MTTAPIPEGKLPADQLGRLLGAAGPMPASVLLGPAVGEDACALDVDGAVVVAATDPITLTGSDVGRYAVHINANDVAVSGARPRWFLAAILLPPGTTADLVESLFASMREALGEVGAALVGGHTEVTGAVNQPVVVGQMLGVAGSRGAVATHGARVGDVVVQVGPVPIEGAAVLAGEAADRLADVPPGVLEAARRATRDPGISVVEAALAACDLGATAMHDPTEGGLAAGLHELAVAAGAAIRVRPERLVWFEPGLAVCRALGADPLSTLASGALLATFPPDRAAEAVDRLATAEHPAAPIGVVEPGEGVRDEAGADVPWPTRDEAARLLAS